MNTYKAVTDKIIALIPLETTGDVIIGGILLPPGAKKATMDRNPIAEIVVHSVGPDCKTVRRGDKILYNRFNYALVPAVDCQILMMPESSVIAVVVPGEEPKAEPATAEIGKPLPEPESLTVEQIRELIKKDQAIGENLPEPEAPPAAAST